MLNTTLISTRASSQSGGAHEILAAAGVQMLDFPLQHIGPPGDLPRFHAALAALPQTDLAIPVSPTAVAAVFAALRQPWPARCAIGVVGEGSLRAVRRALTAQPDDAPWPRLIAPGAAPPGHGFAQPAPRGGQENLGRPCVSLRGDEPGGEGDSEALWNALQLAFAPGPVASFPWAGRHALIFRGGPGRDLLQRKLEAAGAKVKVIEAYSRLAPEYNAQTAALLQSALGSGGWWLFSSTEAVHNLQRLLEPAGLDAAVLHPQRALAIHPRIASALSEAGFGRVELTRAPLEEVLSTLHRLAAAPSLTDS
ncbi:uroporphyrinogen-III synthase [Thiomonas arsenitoxydans]|uniref:uroporphyrinogen-III synthase n=1 Tax=Thiomonas arsenitoxydans (strain DSM 22701 / CIP 110005 / 3As) TaxID=426114 RepID=UPI001AC465CC|nr:uroporphyrinogen-III synthase [Thiomonas arsenitoxydans]MBN8777354.1 uroporphyrinogen-III synthase [Thiomonas arsenitoxydans]